MSAVFGGGASPMAAFEWRAAWAAPYTLPIVESLIGRPDRAPKVQLTAAMPFDLPKVRFQSVCVGSENRLLAIHGGLLTAPGLKESHFGVGRRFQVGRLCHLLTGLRYFSVVTGGIPAGWQLGLTMMVDISPRWLPGLTITAGLVDQPAFATDHQLVSPLSLIRFQLQLEKVHLSGERQFAADGEVETSFALAIHLPAFTFYNSYRIGTGEGGIGIRIPAGPAVVGLIRRWHPELGWTAAFSICWSTSTPATAPTSNKNGSGQKPERDRK